MIIKISPIVEINQNGKHFYIGKIKLADLINCATVFRRSKAYSSEEYNAFNEEEINKVIENKNLTLREADYGTQRRDSVEKLKKIGKYLEEDNGFFPNSFIVSIDPIKNYTKEKEASDDFFSDLKLDQEIIKINKDSISFDSKYAQVKIIDGQHRFLGFNFIKNKELLKEMPDNFECILTIFINLPNSEQADLFATINSTQKPVNKSVLTDLKALSFERYKRLHVCNAIAKWFNEREDPKRGLKLWKGQINMLGIGEGIISQGMFVETISRLITNDKENKKGVLYDLYSREKYDEIYFTLKEYFSIYELTFPEEWTNFDYLLCKTVGFVSMIKIFEILYADYKKSSANFRDFIQDKLNKFKTSKNYDTKFFKRFGSSLSDANKMSEAILESIYSKEELTKIRTLLKMEKGNI